VSLRTGRGLAFSTLGCSGEPIDEVLAHARMGKCGGLELRCRDGELITPRTTLQDARGLGSELERGGVEPVCLASYVQVGASGDDIDDDLDRHIALAAALGAPFVRVFGGDPLDRAVPQRAAARLRDAQTAAAAAGVTVLLETHDALLDGRAVASVLEAAATPTAGALWDVVNPWRAGEQIDTTAALLAPWLRHVQVKDVASTDDLRPVIPGEGRVPLDAFLDRLADDHYDGWISLEWEAAWYPGSAPLDEALIALNLLTQENTI
jgi:sugar phosphate isomerase/epimerase